MNKFRFALVALLILCGWPISSELYSQNRFTAFSKSSQNYLREMTEFYETDRNMKKEVRKDFENLVLRYTDLWLRQSNLQQQDLIELSNLMLKNRLRVYPHFYTFLEVQLYFDSAKQSKESYVQWIKGLTSLLKDKKGRQFTLCIERSLSLLKENAFYASTSVTWRSDATDFMFRSDSVRSLYVLYRSPMNLTYASQKDSTTIVGTTGLYDIIEEAWYGEGGKVYWDKVGLDKDKVWASLKTYSVSVRRTSLFADSVSFLNTHYLQKPILGTLEDHCGDKVKDREVAPRYPLFVSYKREETIKNIAPGVDYVGGFTMQGGNLVGSGTGKDPAQLRFYKEGKVFAQTKGIEYSIRPDRILARDAHVTFYMDGDSIYHPGLNVKYTPNDKMLVCSGDKTGITASPWIDSYHKVDIYTEAVYANLNEYFVEFTAVKGPNPRVSTTFFESEDYYSKNRYEQLQGLDEVHPLYRIWKYCEQIDTNAFTVDEYAMHLRMDRTQVKFLLMNLASNGFLIYEGYREMVFMKPKVYKYIRAAAGLKDYDAIRIGSTIAGKPNARLNLLNKDLRMSGLESFTLSDTHNVVVKPLNGEMVMKKNRDFVFDGRIVAGRFDMEGRNCEFSYDEFKLKLPHVDTLSFYVTMFDDTTTLIKTRTSLQNLNCELLIDHPSNRAGLKKLPDYPILTSSEPCYAYYDRNNLQGEVYDKERFFYKLEPFQVKNIFSFKTENLEFKGELTSAGIFPPIKQPLKVMPDYSLGFKIETPQEGYPIYGGKGHYFNSIDLSNNGLLGTGRLDYVSSISYSDKFIFMPDSMRCETKSFTCADASKGKSSMEFPQVSVSKTKEYWYPYQDKMYVHQAAEKFFMYGGESLHEGYLVVQPSGLTGGGESKVGELFVHSDRFTFKKERFSADTSNMKIHSISKDAVAYIADNVKATVDFKTRKSSFVSNEGVKETEFPYLQYICYVDKSEWGLDSKELFVSNSQSDKSMGFEQLNLKQLIDKQQPGALFVSKHPQQRNLQFHALQAKLRLDSDKLTAKDVFLVHVADAVIGPGGNTITILPGAVMDTIENGKILMDTSTRLHEIENARIFISGTHHYDANGTILYVDENGQKQKVFLHTIRPVEGISRGMGNIAAVDDFKLSSAFRFQGQMEVTASDSTYLFDGGAQIVYRCQHADKEPAWVKFKFRIDPRHIAIPFTETAVDIHGNRVTASIAHTPISLQPYVAFMSTEKLGDNAFISSTGLLSYNKTSKTYEIGNPSKDPDAESVYIPDMVYNPATCKLSAKGFISMGSDFPGVEVKTYGEISAVEGKEEGEVSVSLKMKFPFAKTSLDYMGLEIYEDLNLQPFELEQPHIREQIFAQCLKNSEEIYSELLQVGEWQKIPDELQSDVYLTKVNLQWDPILRSFISKGDLELSMIADKQMNKLIKGKVQFEKNRVGDEIHLYFEVDYDHWYYFAFENSSLRAVSSLENFNSFLTAVPVQERQIKYNNNRMFRYGPAAESDKRRFIRKVEFKEIEETQPSESENKGSNNSENEDGSEMKP